MAAEKFSVSYDADDKDYKNHKIDAYTLGNAIIGVYDLIAVANETINDGAALELKVTSPVVDEGSVIIDFLLEGAPQALEVLRYIGISGVAGAFAGGSLLEVVKALKNRKITSIVIEGDDENAKIEVDGQTIVCNRFVAKMAVDRKVRQALHSVVQAPIQGKKEAVFKVLDEHHKEVETVKESAASNFSILAPGSLETTEKTKEKITAYFVRVDFDSGKGWRIRRADGSEQKVEVADEVFLNRVGQNKHAFKKDDLFEMEIEINSTYRPSRATHDYKVNKVTKHFVDKRRRLV